ncbi:hypothetical protein ALPR1_08728 [Algoriphagus machipongonensis]|uniref:Lipoprotein n=2 Tax=Algoriphagus machipongonensis TaxID=388413 RepID=A3I1N0_9BACT|nr:hypothetical protein ALPR1_08728 [Algoriphagus machipongonensis]
MFLRFGLLINLDFSMKNYFQKLVIFALTLSVYSCGEKTQTDNKPKVFSIELADSLEVDFLKEMRLLDYDPNSKKFLLATEEPREYLEVDQKGEILTHNQFNRDGIDVVGHAVSLGYFNGDVTVFDFQNGYMMFDDSTKVGEITLPYSYDVFIPNPKLGLFEHENKVYYPKPAQHSLMANHEDQNMFQAMYSLPIIESQDKATKDISDAIDLPESSPILNGQVHGFTVPIYTFDEDQLVLSLGIEPRLYVYQMQGGQFIFEKTIDVNIPDWIGYKPVPMETPEKFFEEIRKIRPANLNNIFVLEDYYLVTYHRGISEEGMQELEFSERYGLGALREDPYFVAVFDKDFNQLATNVPFPVPVHAPMVVNENGEIVVSKIAGLSETEDDGIVLYFLQLAED